MLTDIPNERGEFRFRELRQSLTKELWHFNFILGCIHVLKSEGIEKKKKAAFLLECFGVHRHWKFSAQSLCSCLKFCYCVCWGRPPSWLSCMTQCLWLSGIHSFGLCLPMPPAEVWSGKLHSKPNTSWQREGQLKIWEHSYFYSKEVVISGCLLFRGCSVF